MTYVAAAYIVTFVVIGCYIGSVVLRARAARRELTELAADNRSSDGSTSDGRWAPSPRPAPGLAVRGESSDATTVDDT